MTKEELIQDMYSDAEREYQETLLKDPGNYYRAHIAYQRVIDWWSENVIPKEEEGA